jgi:hypothetical protein
MNRYGLLNKDGCTWDDLMHAYKEGTFEHLQVFEEVDIQREKRDDRESQFNAQLSEVLGVRADDLWDEYGGDDGADKVIARINQLKQMPSQAVQTGVEVHDHGQQTDEEQLAATVSRATPEHRPSREQPYAPGRSVREVMIDHGDNREIDEYQQEEDDRGSGGEDGEEKTDNDESDAPSTPMEMTPAPASQHDIIAVVIQITAATIRIDPASAKAKIDARKGLSYDDIQGGEEFTRAKVRELIGKAGKTWDDEVWTEYLKFPEIVHNGKAGRGNAYKHVSLRGVGYGQ